jgi:hypothetical protein
MTNQAADALARLDVLIGEWKTAGLTTDVPARRIDAVDTYERLPGGALLHLVDARVGDTKVEGAEIIGFDPELGTYATQFFGTGDATAYEAHLADEDGTLVWTMISARNRFRGTFNAERDVITGHWELLDDDSRWQPWMDITLTKQPS